MPWLSSYGELCATAAIFGVSVGAVYSNGPLVYQVCLGAIKLKCM